MQKDLIVPLLSISSNKKGILHNLKSDYSILLYKKPHGGMPK